VDDFAQLTGPGLDAPIKDRAQARAYLERLFSVAKELSLQPGTTVTHGRTTFREWVGNAKVDVLNRPQPQLKGMTYGISERFTRNSQGKVEWELAFDTLDMVATPSEIADLRKILFPPKAS
jgi:hypothetical protein